MICRHGHLNSINAHFLLQVLRIAGIVHENIQPRLRGIDFRTKLSNWLERI